VAGQGCGDDGRGAGPVSWELPPAGGGFDYQLGAAYPPDADVELVVRDRTAEPASGTYSVCYVNGFQTQPGEADRWLEQHPDLVLRDAAGEPLVDPEWPDELALDVSTAEQRAGVLAVVGPWIDGCAASGFDAVEIDNLDSYTRFDGLDEDDAVALAAAYAERAHAAGLAIAQKNSAELLARRDETGFDFALVEQCSEFGECDAFVTAYDGLVFAVEYDEAAFAEGCEQHPDLALVLRDLDLVAPGDAGYVRRSC
jgi:hypothetical protein